MAAGGEAHAASTTRPWRTAALGCLLVAVIVAIAWPAPVRATTLERLSIEQLSRRATMVVEGAVVSTAVEQTPAGVRTAVRIKVRESLKGAPSALMTVYVPGGTLPDGSRVVVDAMAAFRPGDSCYVFVDTRGWVMGGLQGKLDVAGGRLLGSGETTAAMSRRIEAALHAARPAARRACGARRTGQEGARGVEPVPFMAGVVGDAADDRVLPGVAAPAEAELHPATSPPGEPTIISITPGEASAGTDTHVTIGGADFGSARGKVEFSYGREDVMRISARDISSWTDSSIDCAVPTGVIANYDASAGSGPVVVTTSDDRESNAFDFAVPFGYGAQKWAKAGATYLVDPSGIDDALREGLVDAGAAVWNAAGSRFRFTDGGTTLLGRSRDGRNVISWADGLPEGVIGQASSYYNAAGDMTEADVQFSNAFAWSDGAAGSGTMDIQTITMHEIGHWLVLLDQYMDGDSGKVMYGFGDADQQKRALAAGDLAGITWIYRDQPIDTVGPVCDARNATVRRGAAVQIYFRVHDALSSQVTTELVISNRSGIVEKSWSWGYGESSNGWRFVRYRCTLPWGSYRIRVSGRDLAGNSAGKVGKATLTVQ